MFHWELVKYKETAYNGMNGVNNQKKNSGWDHTCPRSRLEWLRGSCPATIPEIRFGVMIGARRNVALSAKTIPQVVY